MCMPVEVASYFQHTEVFLPSHVSCSSWNTSSFKRHSGIHLCTKPWGGPDGPEVVKSRSREWTKSHLMNTEQGKKTCGNLPSPSITTCGTTCFPPAASSSSSPGITPDKAVVVTHKAFVSEDKQPWMIQQDASHPLGRKEHLGKADWILC